MRFVLFFITGTSSSGKTTLMNNLKDQLPFARIHDIDEDGVPKGADEAWRRGRTDYFLKEAQNYKRDGRIMVVCGVFVPDEIKKSRFYDSSLNVHYGFIHLSESQIRERLTRRKWSNELIDANIIWAKHLERYVKAETKHLIVNGGSNNPQEVSEIFVGWIVNEMVK